MANVAVITDSTTSLPLEMYEQYGITMVPYYIHLQGQTLRDMVDITPQELCDYMQSLTEKAELPKTANPGPGDYLQAFLSAARHTREMVSIHMTSRGSGAYQAALIAREMALEKLHHVRIKVIDTSNVSMGHGWIALQAARAAAAGASLEDILHLIGKMLPVTRMIQTADTLRYLYMGGRIGRVQHLLGSLLKIKPLISMENGEIVSLGVARSRKEAYRKIATLVQKAIGAGAQARIALTHAAAFEGAQALLQATRQVVAPSEVLFCELSPALIVHTGPGTVGLCYVPEAALK